MDNHDNDNNYLHGDNDDEASGTVFLMITTMIFNHLIFSYDNHYNGDDDDFSERGANILGGCSSVWGVGNHRTKEVIRRWQRNDDNDDDDDDDDNDDNDDNGNNDDNDNDDNDVEHLHRHEVTQGGHGGGWNESTSIDKVSLSPPSFQYKYK